MDPPDYELLIQRALGVPDAVTSANRKRIAALRLVLLAEVTPPKGEESRWVAIVDAVVPRLIEHAYGLAQQGEFDYAFAHVDEPRGRDGSTESVAAMLHAQEGADGLGEDTMTTLKCTLVSSVVEHVRRNPHHTTASHVAPID